METRQVTETNRIYMQHDALPIIFGWGPHQQKQGPLHKVHTVCAHQHNQPHYIQTETNYRRVARVLGLEDFCNGDGEKEKRIITIVKKEQK